MKWFFLLFSCIALHVSAQPATEIYLFDLTASKKKITLTSGENITNHKGYDNQPSFHPNEPVVYYSSFNDEGRADIMGYNYKTKQGVSITQTKEREYSPTVTPDKQYLSCIIQRDSGATDGGPQDLGKYPIHGGEPSVIISHLVVGYHVWADNSHLGLFVLGNPHSLHFLRLPTKKDTIIATNIGRSLHRVPGENAISFVQRISDKEAIIKKLNTHNLVVTDVTQTINGRDDLCWLPDGRILMSDGPKIYSIKPGPGATWTEVTIDTTLDLSKGISRLAVSQDGKKIAIVVTE